ncbi:hypothetical protein [Ruegeria spongiae]|uniref:hypothetical protein n=1 Tax=Ruegeria spongiae TaxID=2942209 RepID=UPI003570955C
MLYGQSGNDDLHGGYGDGKLWGGFGNDDLYGGRDSDVLHGRSGSARFRVSFSSPLLGGYDEPESLSYQISPNSPIVADA